MRHQQRTVYEALSRAVIPDARDLLWDKWMLEVDTILEDEDLIEIVHEALGQRCQESRTRGRRGTPSEVVLRLLVLKHLKNWSYQTLEGEVRANLVYREFTRIGGEKVPDDKTMVRLGQALGPQVIRKIHKRVVKLARKKRVMSGRRMRVDTTVVESNMHYPTDSSLLADGVRVITRTMGKIERKMGTAGKKFRNRMRSVNHRLIEMGRAVRGSGQEMVNRRRRIYRKLMATTRQVIRGAELIVQEVAAGTRKAANRKRQRAAEGLARQAQQVCGLTRRVLEQTKARVIDGNTHHPGKLLSLFEVDAEAIRKGKLAKPTEFGKLVKIQEAERQIITDYQVYAQRPADQTLLLPSIEAHREIFERPPDLVAADAGFYSAKNEAQATAAGVRQVAIPNKQTRSPARRAHQRQRWFRRARSWRVGSEGRISVLKRRHGLFRSRYKGAEGMQRWVGLGVIADNLINIGSVLAAR
ncbi:MAG: ISNCY family transposase [Acidobacteriota bacterium]